MCRLRDKVVNCHICYWHLSCRVLPRRSARGSVNPANYAVSRTALDAIVDWDRRSSHVIRGGPPIRRRLASPFLCTNRIGGCMGSVTLTILFEPKCSPPPFPRSFHVPLCSLLLWAPPPQILGLLSSMLHHLELSRGFGEERVPPS